MARRGAKKGNTRMDAALDAMKPYGFDLKLARKTVRELLKVYGGDEGWVFIEEASYKLLVETILDNQKPTSEPEEEHDVDNDTNNNGQSEELPAASSIAFIESTSTNTVVDVDAVSQTGLAALSSSAANSKPGYTAARESRGIFNLKAKAPQPEECVSKRKRKPCHGWISESDNDDDDMIHLPPKYTEDYLYEMMRQEGGKCMPGY